MRKKLRQEIVLFKAGNINIEVAVTPEQETVWLTQKQMSQLFDIKQATISEHITNILNEGELDETSIGFSDKSTGGRKPRIYNLDMILSVGYRVNSKRGIEFRKWANSVLKQYIIRGYALNEHRMKQLGEAVRLMKRIETDLDTRQVLNVVERFSKALDLLDDYDHQTMKRPKGSSGTYVLTYEECRQVIDQMRFGAESELFGSEKDGSFKGSIGNITLNEACSAGCGSFIQNFAQGLSMTTEEQVDYWNKMWRNFNICDTYEPGSTFKLLTSSIALDTGVTNLTEQFYCGASIQVYDWQLKCWNYGLES